MNTFLGHTRFFVFFTDSWVGNCHGVGQGCETEGIRRVVLEELSGNHTGISSRLLR